MFECDCDDLQYQLEQCGEEIENLKDKLDEANDKIEKLEWQIGDYQELLIEIFIDVFGEEFPVLREIKEYQLMDVIDAMARSGEGADIDEVIMQTMWIVFGKRITKDMAKNLRGATLNELEGRLVSTVGISEVDRD